VETSSKSAAKLQGNPGSVQGRLNQALEDAIAQTQCNAIAVARRDGLVVVHRLPPGGDPRLVAAIAAATAGSSRKAAEELGQGTLEHVVIECSQGTIIVTETGPRAILVALFAGRPDLAAVRGGLRESAERIEAILEEV